MQLFLCGNNYCLEGLITKCIYIYIYIQYCLACEQAHLIGKGGGAAIASRRSRREEWGEEKWACTRAIEFWIPRVRWRTQRSDWLKMTGYKNQLCNDGVCRLCSRSVLQAFDQFGLKFRTKRRAENSCELFTGRKGCFRCDTDRFRQEFYFSAVLHSDRTEEDFRRIASEQCDFSYLPVEKPDWRPIWPSSSKVSKCNALSCLFTFRFAPIG